MQPSANESTERGLGRVLFISPGNSYRIFPFIAAAKKLGAEIIVASEGEHTPVVEYYHGIAIDLGATDFIQQLLAALKENPPTAVIGTDDSTVEPAARVAEAFGLKGNPPSAAQFARRKDLAREALREAGLPAPQFRVLNVSDDPVSQLSGFDYPLVLKPVALSASRGVIRCDTEAQLREAWPRVVALAAESTLAEERTRVLVEAYLPGREFAFEGLLDDGQLQMLALFDKPDPLEGPYFEETYYITPARIDVQVQDNVLSTVAQACSVYGLSQGPVHAEVRIDGDNVWILEVAGRTIGGQCARLLEFGGMALEEVVVRQTLGLPVPTFEHQTAAGVLMLPIEEGGVLRRVEGVLAAQRVEYIEEVQIAVREGYRLLPLPEGNSYLGFIFARAPTPEAVEEALRAAHAELRVVVAPYLALQQI